MAKGKRNLSLLGAVWNAFWARDIEYFPRLNVEGTEVSFNSDQILQEISAHTENLIDARIDGVADSSKSSSGAPSSDILKDALERGRESLDEVKSLTEYQDQKATRLLTITTFLSALSGVLFARFNHAYPLPESFDPSDWRTLLVVGTHLAFALFVLSAIGGAIVIFHATRTRFKFPETETERRLAEPRSHLFFPAIVSVRPSAWARSFVGQSVSSDSLQPRSDLSIRYLRNYIGESYLVAAKVADKVRYLEPAQDILAFALRCLLVWLVLTGIVNVLVEPASRSDTQTREVENIPPLVSRDDTEEQPITKSQSREGNATFNRFEENVKSKQ